MNNRYIAAALERIVPAHDIVHVHGTWRYHSRGTARVAHAHGVPFILRPYGNLGIEPRNHKSWLKKPYFWLLERPAANKAAAIHCMTIKELQELEGIGLTPRRFVVPNPVEADLLNTEPDEDGLAAWCPALKPGSPTALFLGRFTFIKRLEILVEAFIALHGDFPQWQLVLAGPHEEQGLAQRLRSRIDESGLADRILMPGEISGGRKVALLHRTELYCQPSSHENFCVSVAEAMLFGVASVVSDGVGLSADVETAGAGLVSPCAAVPFSGAMRSLMEDEERRSACARRARQLSSKFHPSAVAEQLAIEYETCMEGATLRARA